VALFQSNTLGRNEPCHCGSGKKYKQCCLAKDEAAERAARAKAAEKAEKADKADKAEKGETAAAPEPAPAPAKAAPRAPKHATDQPWKSGGLKNTRSFQKVRTPRKVGGS
jgi:SEC-C motif-containing protein